MPSETGIAVTQGETKRGRGRKFAGAGLMRLDPALDDLYQRIASGNHRLTIEEAEKLCALTPAMIYAIREIGEGRVTAGAMATIEAFDKMSRIAYRVLRAGKQTEPDAGKTVIFQINVAEIRPEVAAAEPKLVLDVKAEPEPEKQEVPTISITVNE